MVDDTLYIYLEYVSRGSIHQLLREYGQFGEPSIRSYTWQILAGLAYLHGLNTVHRDIKGANILVDPNGQVKLADFGMAKHVIFLQYLYTLSLFISVLITKISSMTKITIISSAVKYILEKPILYCAFVSTSCHLFM